MKSKAWIEMVVAMLVGSAQAAPQQRPPAFEASGVQANTAPSGYSAGASEEDAHQVRSMVGQLQEISIASSVASGARLPCARQAELLHDAVTEPDSFQANHELGRFYLQHGSASLAARYLKASATIKPEDSENLKSLAVASLEAHLYEEASVETAALVKSQPLDADAHRLRGASYAAEGDETDAVAEYGRSIALDAGARSVYAGGLGMLAAGSLGDGEISFDLGTSFHPGSAELWFGRGLADFLNGRRVEAVESLLKAATLGSSDLVVYTLLAHLAGVVPAANPRILNALETMVKQQPGKALLHYDYALALFKSGPSESWARPAAQIDPELKEAIREEPSFAAAHYQLGLTYFKQGREPAGIAEMAVAVQQEPGVAEWRYRLARAYRRNHQAEDADQQMQQFQRLSGKRDAGQDVAARLFEGLPALSMGQAPGACEGSQAAE